MQAPHSFEFAHARRPAGCSMEPREVRHVIALIPRTPVCKLDARFAFVELTDQREQLAQARRVLHAAADVEYLAGKDPKILSRQ